MYKHLHYKNMKYKPIIVVLTTVMVLSLTACGKSPAPDKSELSVSTDTQVESPNEAEAPANESAPADTDTSTNDEAWKRSLRKACWKTMALRRIIMKIWVTAFIRST